jgi:hypothetical protein
VVGVVGLGRGWGLPKGTVSRNGDRGEPMEPKLMVKGTFFCLKLGRLKATVRRVPHPLM